VDSTDNLESPLKNGTVENVVDIYFIFQVRPPDDVIMDIRIPDPDG
jgi:hypothetical protein